MKFRSFFLLACASLMMSACIGIDPDDDKDGGTPPSGTSNTPPSGALPSAEFTLNDLPAESYANEAVRIEAKESESGDLPFSTFELFPNGTYLMTYSYNYDYSETNSLKTRADSSAVFHQRTGTLLTRSAADDNGTTYFYGGEYGTFEVVRHKVYRLSNGDEIDLTELGESQIYYSRGGRTSTVYVEETSSRSSDATKSLCRTWDFNSLEMWVYLNGKYVDHVKIVPDSGNYGDDELAEELADALGDAVADKVIFSKNGTYLLITPDGSAHLRNWRWQDEQNGILYWSDNSMGGQTDGSLTVRFAGKQMRFYEDYTTNAEGNSVRMVIVTTLTAVL